MVHSTRKGDPLEGDTSSSLRENRLVLLGSVYWSLSPPSLAPPQTLTSPPVSLSPSLCFCLSLFMSLSISLFVSVSLSLEFFSPLHHPILLSLGEKSAVSCFSEPCLHAASTGSSVCPVLIMQRLFPPPDLPGSASDGLAGELTWLLPVPPRRMQTGCQC